MTTANRYAFFTYITTLQGVRERDSQDSCLYPASTQQQTMALLVFFQVAFIRRKNVLMRKAMELSVLCECDVSLILFTSSGTLHQYSSGPMEELLERYSRACQQPHEWRCNDDVSLLTPRSSVFITSTAIIPSLSSSSSSTASTPLSIVLQHF